jgi:glycosyltransferase involved in cell wall biosynthesis
MKERIRLIVVEPNGSGGLIHYAYQLCTALANEGADVRLITSTNYELLDFPHNFQVDNTLNLWKLFDPLSMLDPPKNPWKRCRRKLNRLIRRGLRAYRLIREWIRLTTSLIHLKPDLIQFGKINFPFETLFLLLLRRKGLILSQICHEFERREKRGIISSIIDRSYAVVYSNFSVIFFHAQENLNRFMLLYPFIPKSRTYIIPHGNEGIFLKASDGAEIDTRKKYGLSDDIPVALFFGVLTPSKGLMDLIDAVAIARKSCRFKLLIAGYPSKYLNINELKKQTEDNNLKEVIIFDTRYIPLNEVGSLMRLATVVIYPYRSSTQSGSLQVAFTFGRPVIATDVGGLPEVIHDGQSGFIVPPKNPALLAEKIVTLVKDPDLAEMMGANAKQISESQYGWNPIAQKMIAIYQELLSFDNQ